MSPDPISQFDAWLRAAREGGHPDPTAMTLATATADGRPSARMVLLKSYSERGFTFFTNYESRKAGELEATRRAALCFWFWKEERQVRVEGAVERLSVEESSAYFETRPRGSRVGAWASAQSRPVASREALDARVREVEARFPDGAAIPLPPHWGGYRVVPDRIELWQGRASRLHDRLVYTRAADGAAGWTVTRLMP